MGESIPSIRLAYQAIKSESVKFGQFKKCEMHLHTPASYDYNLMEGQQYKNLNEQEIFSIALEQGIYKLDYTLELAEEEFDKLKLETDDLPIDSLKDFIGYSVIAYKLYTEKIDLVVICDHNTVDGYDKLAYMLEYHYERYFKYTSQKHYVDILLGVEISCSDKNHLVAIFEKDYKDDVSEYLDEILLNRNCKEGTYIDSRTLMEILNKKYSAITYLAHLNTSEFLGSIAYNKALFNSKTLNLIGISDLEKIQTLQTKLKKYNPKKEFTFVLEGDAHFIEEIGKKNTWIKFQKKNFKSLVRAIQNRAICISAGTPDNVTKYIEGIMIVPTEKGFLTSINKPLYNSFYTVFSQDLNCLIGGTGTGKSTLIKTLEIVLTRQCSNEQELEQISNNKIIYCLIHIDNKEYIISFIPQADNEARYHTNRYRHITRTKEGIKLGTQWIQLYEYNNGEFKKQTDNTVDIILNKIFRRSYSINELVSQIADGKINSFIKNAVTYGVQYDVIEKYELLFKQIPTQSFAKTLRSTLLNEMIIFMEDRKKLIEESILSFNTLYKNIIEVKYSPKLDDSIDYLEGVLDSFEKKGNINSTYLTWRGAQVFIKDCVDKLGYLKFLTYLLNDKYRELERVSSIAKYQEREISFYQAERNLEEVTSSNIKGVYREIKNRFVKNRDELEYSIIKCLRATDDFTILFNINSREAHTQLPCIMKDIKNLSLGQKVVALLTFVFNFGLSNNDNTTLIIDQPEDNLDNQYIYKNLVSSLRMIKAHRQVIIATHSSTIVTNADAEQVIVLESDNEKGWIGKQGYPSEKNIIKHIINYMEGGVESFKHKKEIYQIFIPLEVG